MKRNDRERLRRMREGDRREALKEEGRVNLPPNKTHTPKPIKERHKAKRIRPHELEEEDI